MSKKQRIRDLERRVAALERLQPPILTTPPTDNASGWTTRTECGCPPYTLCNSTACPRALRAR